MNLLHLHYFFVVAKENGFTKASKVLRIQQPAISRMVKTLEENMGLKLFEKVGRNVQLSRHGAEVFEHCKKIFGAVENLEQSLGQIGGEHKGPLLVAAAEPIASHFLPPVINSYLKKYPRIYPNIYSGPASMLFEKILGGDIELGIFFHIPNLPEKLEIFAQRKTKFHLVIRKDLSRKKGIIETFIGSREIDDTTTRHFVTPS
jgi:DNA-binding transcriptional LysR family regulator